VPSPRRATALTQRAAALEEARSALAAGECERVLRLLRDEKFDRREDRVAAAIVHARALLALDRHDQDSPMRVRCASS